MNLIAYVFWKNFPEFKFNPVKLILGFTVLGYLIQAFSNISVISVAPLFWILLGHFSSKTKEVY
jgi:putative inorganic carbon (HCO3(-)) transporter